MAADDLRSLATTPLDDLLQRGLCADPDAPAVVTTEQQFSWRELAEASDRLACNYVAIGLQRGDRVASLMPNCAELVIHYLACLKASLVATPLNYRYVATEIDHALDVSRSRLLLHHAERDESISQTRLAGTLPLGVVRFEAADGGGRHLEELISQLPGDFDLPLPKPDAPAFIYFTSGSTGKPKGVTHSRRTYAAMIDAACGGIELTSADTFLPGSSISHVAGSLFALCTLATGGTTVISRGSGGPEILSLLRQYRPTVLCMLPAPLLALVEDHAARREDFSSIRLCLSGGDKVAAQLEDEFVELAGFEIDESYGMTEIGLAALNPPLGENRLGSIGRLCPGFEMSLRDEAGTHVGVGTQGRFWVRSPSVMTGYWEEPQATAETIVDDWLDTGDLMRCDEDGYLWFCGRKKQIIIHDGSNICPQEIEEAVMQHPAVELAGVIGIHNLAHGENVRAYVTLHQGAQRPTAHEIIEFARARVGYKAPEEIVFLESMPLNATGKVDRVRLKQLAGEHLEVATAD
jgi:long-chain acyl-CoA synthetase